MIELKNIQQIKIMDEANRIVHDILLYAKDSAKEGISTFELDKLMEDKLGSMAISAFKGYRGYPAVSCISVNQTVVHGIPSKDQILKDGDLVSIDFGAYHNGFAGDSAITFPIGEVSDSAKVLMNETRKALYLGIASMIPGNKLYDIAEAIESVAKENNFGNVIGFCGHGIGKKMHEKPSVFNYIDKREPNITLRPGIVLALEPMFTLGSSNTIIEQDNWTANTIDGSLAAHWEVSVAITEDGPQVLGGKL